jgi:signal transduction histidine kinase
MNAMALRILLVDDNPFDRELAARGLRTLAAPLGPVALTCAADWAEGTSHLQAGCFDLLLLDYNLPGLTGLDILRELETRAHPPVVMITGQEDLSTAVETLRAGAYDYVPKASDWGRALCLTIERVTTRVRLEREVAEAHTQLQAHAAELERQVELRTALIRTQATEIEELYLKAEEAARVKEEIVANVSHELRTPLNVILGYADLLAERFADIPDASEMLLKVRGQGERLHQLVEALLALSRLSAGQEGLDPSRFPISQLLDDLRATAATLNANDRLTVEWEMPPEPCEVTTDREKIRTIAYHLLSNAIKFTPAGRVAVAARPTPDGGLVLAVSDTGIGLPPEACATALEDFRQLDGSTTRRYDGLGLGLGIVRRYTSLLGGQIQIESSPGTGTQVTVALPPAAAR